MGSAVHPGWLEAGATEVATLPEPPPARHSDADGQVTDRKPLGSTPFVFVHADFPPPGLVDASSFPLLSPATHRPPGVQPIAFNESRPSIWTVVHVGVAANGLDEVTT